MASEITREESEERGFKPRRSGFASPEFWTEERRQKQREWAKKAHEDGRFGGRQPGAGRPKIKTVAQVISEEAQKDGTAIYRELKLMALQHKSPAIKLGAIDRILNAEQTVQKNMRDDEKELLKLTGKSLDEKLIEVMEEHNLQGDIDIPEADVVEDESIQLEEEN